MKKLLFTFIALIVGLDIVFGQISIERKPKPTPTPVHTPKNKVRGKSTKQKAKSRQQRWAACDTAVFDSVMCMPSEYEYYDSVSCDSGVYYIDYR